MQVRNKRNGQVFTLVRQDTDSVISLLSPSGEVVEQEISAGVALLVDDVGNTTACSEPVFIDEYEEVTSG